MCNGELLIISTFDYKHFMLNMTTKEFLFEF